MATPTAEVEPATALELDATERAILEHEVDAFAASLKEPDSRARYGELAAAVQEGRVPAPLVGFLETMLELLLQTGRVRREHGPAGEQALLRLFHRTPRGAALKGAAAEVNEALQAIQGHTLEALTFTPTPRGHTIVVQTGCCLLTLAVDRDGVRVEKMELGGT